MAENQHFASIIRAYDEYRAWGLAKADRLERHYGKLSAADRAVMRVDNKVAGMRAAVEQNARVIAQLVAPHRASVPAGDDPRVQVAMPQPDGSTRFVPTSRTDYVPESDLEKVQSTLKQFVREWGAEGRAERESAHGLPPPALRLRLAARCRTAAWFAPVGPVLDALRKEFPQPEGVRVLLPGAGVERLPVASGTYATRPRHVRDTSVGAGLGRLVWEVAMAGYVAQGCEFSYFMLIAADFLMNRRRARSESGSCSLPAAPSARRVARRLGAAQETVTLHPWALQTCNAVSAADQLRPAVAPEVPPSDLPEESNLSMCAGDFLEAPSRHHTHRTRTTDAPHSHLSGHQLDTRQTPARHRLARLVCRSAAALLLRQVLAGSVSLGRGGRCTATRRRRGRRW